MATIDERVVSLKMNNKQFLSAIKESSSGMDRLKESLKLQGAADGLSRVGEIAKNTTLGDKGPRHRQEHDRHAGACRYRIRWNWCRGS